MAQRTLLTREERPKYARQRDTISLSQAKKLRYGNHIYNKRSYYSNGCRRVVKVNGAPKTWKKNPHRVQIPYKYGMYEYGYITESDLDDWSIKDKCYKRKKVR